MLATKPLCCELNLCASPGRACLQPAGPVRGAMLRPHRRRAHHLALRGPQEHPGGRAGGALRACSTTSSLIFFSAQVGGQVGLARLLDHIISEFYEALKRVQDIGYDLLDIAAKKYGDETSPAQLGHVN